MLSEQNRFIEIHSLALGVSTLKVPKCKSKWLLFELCLLFNT